MKYSLVYRSEDRLQPSAERSDRTSGSFCFDFRTLVLDLFLFFLFSDADVVCGLSFCSSGQSSVAPLTGELIQAGRDSLQPADPLISPWALMSVPLAQLSHCPVDIFRISSWKRVH